MYQRADGFLQKPFWLYPDLLSYTTLLTICVKVQNINKVDKHGKNTFKQHVSIISPSMLTSGAPLISAG